MAIDSELSAGVMTQAQAKEERKKIAAESDFFGAMDGAAKFVKGDAIAGLIITVINIAGGFVMGIAVWHLSWSECWSTVSCLTIGDGLVTQMPSLFVSLGAAMMVTRSSTGSLGKTLPKQIFHQPKVMVITAALVAILALIPGMPTLVMMTISGVLFVAGFLLNKKRGSEKTSIDPKRKETPLLPILELQLGFEAIRWGAPFQQKLSQVREKVTNHLGITIPAVCITDQTDLPHLGWAIVLKGVKVAGGREAELNTLINSFLSVVKTHAHELIHRQDVALMLHDVKRYDHAVVEELYPKKLSLGQILKVLQNLLKEGVSIRDSLTIFEILADYGAGEKSDLDLLTEQVRQGLAAKISEEFIGKNKCAHVITIDPKIEQMLTASKGILRPKTIDQLARAVIQLEDTGRKQGVWPSLSRQPPPDRS